MKTEIYNLISDIFGYRVINTAMIRELAEISKAFDDETIESYLYDNEEYLSRLMRKDFRSEYGKIRYFSAVLKNNLADYSATRKPFVRKSADLTPIRGRISRRSGRIGLDEKISIIIG